MKLHDPRRSGGYALVTVMFFTSVALLAVASVMHRTATTALNNDRNNRVFTAAAAAEAATEKILTRVTADYKRGGEGAVYENLASYQALVPTSAESPFWSQFVFNNAQGGQNKTHVQRLTTETLVDLNSQYKGLKGFASTYRILSNARESSGSKPITAAVNQDVQVASIPIFQFAIFYGLDLEINTMTTMNISGRVHANRKIYTYPSATLTFRGDVTAVDSIIKTRKPGDPAYSSAAASGSIVYKEDKDTGVAALTLPIGTSNTPDAVRKVIEMPPAGEAIDSPLGKQRYYNKAEMVVLVGNTNVEVRVKTPMSSSYSVIPWSQVSSFISTNITFTDQRESKVVQTTEIDISDIQSWSTGNATVSAVLGANKPVNLIYVADNRSVTSSRMNGVRLINGQTLPSRGLTVATPNPLYVKGHYNQPTSSHLGTTNTSNAKPASLVSDAFTILSSNWADSKSTKSYTSRTAASTTVNAALLTGIVETTNSPAIYSGGVHNLARFLEDWSGDTFTYNGSMVVLFPSNIADAPFEQPGAYYEPPNRNFSFDLNFLDITKQPPGTPELRAIIRGSWALVTPGTTNIVVPN